VVEWRLSNESGHVDVTSSQPGEHEGVDVRLGTGFDDESLSRCRREQDHFLIFIIPERRCMSIS
jgi:hypothetical protein